MPALRTIRCVSILTTGLIAGIYLGDRMGASFARPALLPSDFVKFQQIQHAHFVTMMPVLSGLAILATLAWLALIRSRVGASFLFVGLAALALISVAVLTRTVNVPINNLLMTWSPSSPPPNVMEIWARWEQAHTIRTVIAVIGFACGVVAVGATPTVRSV